MSILIRGMEMPTDHPLWIIVHSDGTVEVNEVSQSRPVGWQTLRNAAVPVPDHGRLIDADALKIEVFAHDKLMKDGWNNMDMGMFTGNLMEVIACAPTIIPEDKEE